MNARRIMVNVDDFELNEGVRRGVMALQNRGAISNTTLMVSADVAATQLLIREGLDLARDTESDKPWGQVLEPFYRLDHSRSRDGGGAGLRLTITLRMATRSGADLTLSNHPGDGLEARLSFSTSKPRRDQQSFQV